MLALPIATCLVATGGVAVAVGLGARSGDRGLLAQGGVLLLVAALGAVCLVDASVPSGVAVLALALASAGAVGIGVSARAIRDDARAAAALREARDSLRLERAAVEGSADAVYLIDSEGRFVYVNRAACTALGYTRDELLARRVFDVDDNYSPERWSQDFDATRGTEPITVPSVHRRRDGGRFPVELSIARHRIGDTDHLFAFVRDMSEHVRAEARFRQLIDNIREVFWLTDWRTHTVLIVSQAYETIWGRSCASLYADARSWADAVHPDDRERVEAAFDRDAEQGLYDVEYRIVRADGSVRWIHDRAFPIRDDDGAITTIAGLSEDVTERKQAEHELIRRSEQERALRRELNHRVRNNLSSLVTLITLTRDRESDLDMFAASIRGRVQAMATVHGLLSASSGATVQLRAIITSLHPGETPGTCTLEGPDIAVPSQSANALSTMFFELMTNSVRHGALGRPGGTVRVRWSVVATAGTPRRVTLLWTERGGPPASAPVPGVGLPLIEGIVRSDLRGTVRLGLGPEGVDHEMRFELPGEASAGDGGPGTGAVPQTISGSGC